MQRLLFRSNVVYKLKRSCGSVYIAKTRRNLIKRLEVHQTSPNSEVCNHLQSNPSYTVDFLKGALNPNFLNLTINRKKFWL